MKYALGKLDYISDPRTLKLADFFLPDVAVATTYDTDAYRRPFPDRTWGNDQYKNSVLAARANAQLRFERIEQKRTIPLTDETVVNAYKLFTGCKKPMDKKDTGLSYLLMMKQWKNEGWKIGSRNYKIAAYGELDPLDREQLKFGCYLLTGVHFGFALPNAVKEEETWAYDGARGDAWKAGSWGGQAAYGYAYNFHGFFVKSWGRNIFVDWAFIERYCDEAWAVIPRLEVLRIRRTLDVVKLAATLAELEVQSKEGGTIQIEN